MIKKLYCDFIVKSYNEDENKDFFTFEGLASTFKKDLDGDTIVKGAFGDIDKSIPILFQHDHKEPIGVTYFSKENDEGLYIKAKLPKDDTLVSGRVIPQMKIGSIKSMSIGFSASRDDIQVKEGNTFYNKVSLSEISLVTFPANTGAKIQSFKSELKDVLKLNNKRELEGHLRELGMSHKASIFISSKVDFDEDKEVKHNIKKINQIIRSLKNGRHE
tara:strand:+ start:1441 stop:2091 length:651 start_codon:yes stop_codon:yes gene_type:complete